MKNPAKNDGAFLPHQSIQDVENKRKMRF